MRERPSSALADCRLPGEIVRGTSPSDAGPKNAEAAPKSAPVMKKSGSVI
jgi:hypothetical protein